MPHNPPLLAGGQGRSPADLAKGPRLALLLLRRWWRLPTIPQVLVTVTPALGLLVGTAFAEACAALGRAW